MAIWLGILLILVPFFVIMVLESRRRRVDHDEDDEEVGSDGLETLVEEEYLGEEDRRVKMRAQKRTQPKPHCGNMLLGLK